MIMHIIEITGGHIHISYILWTESRYLYQSMALIGTKKRGTKSIDTLTDNKNKLQLAYRADTVWLSTHPVTEGTKLRSAKSDYLCRPDNICWVIFQNKTKHKHYRLSEFQKCHTEHKHSRNKKYLNILRYSEITIKQCVLSGLLILMYTILIIRP